MIRPADANETVQAWTVAVQKRSGPVALALSRQNLPHLDVPAGSVAKGAYVIADADGTPDLILLASGSEVSLCLAAKAQLDAEGVKTRVVSMPSFELFEQQGADYREAVLPAGVRARVAVEAGATSGWQRYTGLEGAVIGLDRFGASGDGDTVMEQLGFNVANIITIAKEIVRS